MSTRVDRVSLCSLDVLPAKCSIEMQVALMPEHPGISRVRFRATRPRRFRRRRMQASEWSGWFAYEGEPIALRWDTFWVTP